MMKGLTIQELAAKIEGNKALKRDFVADTNLLTMQVPPVAPGEALRPVLEVDRHGSFPMMPLAHDQVGNRLGIPSKYYDRMLNEAPDLLATNVNAWFRLQPDKRMVRTLGGDVRAFLSNRYKRVENEEIAEVALPILADIPDVRIVSSEITDRRMYIQAVTPRVTAEIKRGDEVQAGVIIRNSEVGCGAVGVAAVIWRLWCLNGMVGADHFRSYHMGRQIDDNEELWAEDTRRSDDSTVLLKVRDMVRACVDETRFRKQVDKMRELAGVKISGNPEAAIEMLSQKVGTTETERGGILRSLIEGGDLSAWGLLNAVTAQAHTARDYDRAVELEVAGGYLVDLAPGQWREILEAA